MAVGNTVDKPRVGRGPQAFLHSPSKAPGQCERVRGWESHVMCVCVMDSLGLRARTC